MEDSQNYGTVFNITYQILKSHSHTSEENIALEFGENDLTESGERVSLSKIYTRWNSICYKVNTTRKVDFSKTIVKLKTLHPRTIKVTEYFFTSEENSYGLTFNKFMEGKVFSTQLTGGNWKEIDLSAEKNRNLECNKESFFEYVASKLTEINFQKCNYTCLRTTLPNEHYPICDNNEEWYYNIMNGNTSATEDDCAWGVVRDLIKEKITSDEHLTTCITTGFKGQIMVENVDDHAINELGVQYKFALPLTAQVHQEVFIIDTIDLVGSVGGTLGLFIGFSFFNLINCLMGYIGKHLADRIKLFNAFLVSVEWLLYYSLMAIAIWFSWGVLDKFYTQDKGVQQYEEKIEAHPTIVICMGSLKYQSDFKIKYGLNPYDLGKINWIYAEEEIVLAMGTNHLETFEEDVILTKIHTRYNGICYAINTTRKVDEIETNVEIMPSSSFVNVPKIISVIFTSEKNSYGIIQNSWRDGESYILQTSFGKFKEIDLTVEKNIHLQCRDESFYEYIASRLPSEDIFEKCNDSCLMTSLPNDPYPICPYYKEWIDKDTKEKESNCNWNVIKDFIQNVTVEQEDLKTCVTTKYLGEIMKERDNSGHTLILDRDDNNARIYYKFRLPQNAKVYEEYLITDTITLIGSVGGTLGLFIGFSISNVVSYIMDFFKNKPLLKKMKHRSEVS